MTDTNDPPRDERPVRRARARRGLVEGGIVAVALAAVVVPLVLSGVGSGPSVPPPVPVPALSGGGAALPDEAATAAPAEASAPDAGPPDAAQVAPLMPVPELTLPDGVLPEPPPPGPPVVESALPPADLSTAPPAPDPADVAVTGSEEVADLDAPGLGSLARRQKLERVERELATAPAPEQVPADAPPAPYEVLPEPPVLAAPPAAEDSPTLPEFGEGGADTPSPPAPPVAPPPPPPAAPPAPPPAAGPPAPAPPAPPAPGPPAAAAFPAVQGVGPGAAADLPANAFGTPVVVTGSALQRAQYWTVGGQRAFVASSTASRVVLVVGPGRAKGIVRWHVGARSEQAGAALERVVPQVLGARPVVWGRTCRFPQQTGLTWVGGDDRGDLTARFAPGGRTVPVRALDGRGLLLITGPSEQRSVEIRRGAWFTRIAVRPELVDLTQLASVSGLSGDRCPRSAGETAVAVARTLPPGIAVSGVYFDRRPQAFVRLPDGRVAVLLPPQHRVSGAGAPPPERLRVGQVLVVDDEGRRRQVWISPLDERIAPAVSLLADAVTGGR